MRKKIYFSTAWIVAATCIMLFGIRDVSAQQPNFPMVKEYRIERSISPRPQLVLNVTGRHTGGFCRLGQKPSCQCQYFMPGLPSGTAGGYGYRKRA